MSDTTVSVIDDCDVPEASFIKQLIFFFSSTSTRRMVYTYSTYSGALSQNLMSAY